MLQIKHFLECPMLQPSRIALFARSGRTLLSCITFPTLLFFTFVFLSVLFLPLVTSAFLHHPLSTLRARCQYFVYGLMGWSRGMKTQLCRLNWRIATLLINNNCSFLPCIFCDKSFSCLLWLHSLLCIVCAAMLLHVVSRLIRQSSFW
jgi:hypothetical protein